MDNSDLKHWSTVCDTHSTSGSKTDQQLSMLILFMHTLQMTTN